MRCFECVGEVIQTLGSVRMTKKDGSLIIFKGIPLSSTKRIFKILCFPTRELLHDFHQLSCTV